MIIGPQHDKTCLRWVGNNKGSDQPTHPRSLFSAFVIHLLGSIISKLSTSEISIFQLVSATEETGLSLAFSETLKTGFVASRPSLKIAEVVKCRNQTPPIYQIFGIANYLCSEY